MRIVFLKSGETIGVGEHGVGAERLVADDVAGVLIKRGVAAVADLSEWGEDVALEESPEEFCSINETSSRGEQDNGRE